MTPVNERILQRLDELLAAGERVLATHRPVRVPGPVPRNHEGHVDGGAWSGWRVSSLAMILQIAGDQSHYYTEFKEHAESTYFPCIQQAQAVLCSLRDDFAQGWLRDLRELAAAEVFGDLLEMAQHLQEKGYHHGAVSIAGAVLEDCLRRVHTKRIGEWEGDSGISKLGTNLYKHDPEFYPKTRHQQVTAWATLRNEVDHGRAAEVDPGDSKRMIEGVRDLVLRYGE